MLALRYDAGKVAANYALAMIGGIAVVVVLNSIWSSGFLPGGIGALIGVGGMLLIGCINRLKRREPIVVVDARGITIDLPAIGTIPWPAIRRTEIRGAAWVTGVRLVVEYDGHAPKLTFRDKLNWAVQSKRAGPLARVSVGMLDLTDQPISTLKSAINQANPVPAA